MKFGEDFEIPVILQGSLSDEKLKEKQKMASAGGFEERFAVVNLIRSALREHLQVYEKADRQITALYETLVYLKKYLKKTADLSVITEFVENQKNSLQVKFKMELISLREQEDQNAVLRKLEQYVTDLKKEHCSYAEEGFDKICIYFEKEIEYRHVLEETVQKELQNAFAFIQECFGEGQEMLLLLTGITADKEMTSFIAQNGCPAYFQYSGMLLYNKEEKELQHACMDILGE